MTNHMPPSLRSSSLSFSVEHDSNTGRRNESRVDQCRYNGEDKDNRSSDPTAPSDMSSRVPVATDTAGQATKDSSVPNVVEPDQPSSLCSQADRDGSLEGLKRHLCRSSRRSGSEDSLEEDDDSVGSSNTQESGESQNSRKPKRQHAMKVHFADNLISEVFTRPRTLTEDKHLLHYSFEEMDEFREEYNRLCEEEEEQMLLDELVNSSSSDDSSLLDGYPTDCSVLSESSSASDAHLIDDDIEEDECSESSSKKDGVPDSTACSRKHSISKVLVVHHNVDVVCPGKAPNKSDLHLNGNGSTKGGSQVPLVYMATNDKNDYSFDNSAFWNGSLTWY